MKRARPLSRSKPPKKARWITGTTPYSGTRYYCRDDAVIDPSKPVKWTNTMVPYKGKPKPKPKKRKPLRKRGLRAEREREALQHGREVTLARAQGRCERCGRHAPLDVHHVRSRARNPGAPWLHGPENLRAWCRPCHDEEHFGGKM